ncbi:MAG: phosphate acyltransferase PlsX [candidate division KSB1 bacterium]|nr:phosphate acyltransferase PlsX [candidate division KSB1 bacterium]MDZ7364662.1 phosphate acyltransferase PlsX [candidate division KSB1 bacterium]MDZ7402590.1 phosphate acyltransferase PlsX [candidate division KSB1 bacterium]
MRIALDAMGGDHAPAAIVQGGLEAAKLAHGDYEIVFVGDKAQIEQEINRHPLLTRGENLRYSIYHASEKIEMCDVPTVALKKKKDASVLVAARLHREGQVDAVVSAGHTGAAMAASLMELGRIRGVNRPGIGSLIPNGYGVTLLIDVGANVDCKPIQLVQFGLMGSIFMNRVIGLESPKVALLSNGEERSKGTEVIREAYGLLEARDNLNFIGNVEGRDILKGTADVVVCDGFVGNVILKFAESLGAVFRHHIKRQIGKRIFRQIGAFLLQPTFTGLRKIFDYEEYGGAPLLGINGVCIICHGGSTPKAIRNAIREAVKMVSEGVTQIIGEELQTQNGVKLVEQEA